MVKGRNYTIGILALKNELKKAELKDEVSAVAAAVGTVTGEIVSCFDEEIDAARHYLGDQNGPHG